jgi:DNA-binding NtrC family response regulator
LNQRVLFVDDELNVLEGIQRTLRKQVELQTASSGAQALRLIGASGPFAVVISDMRMPAMNGAQFLARVREQEPDTVRMILSGHADLEATIAAVNEGQIYRFLTKPCPTDQLLAAVEDALNQHRLLTAEKVLLELTASEYDRAIGTVVRQIRLADLTVGMTLDEDLVSAEGVRLVPSGTEVTTTLMIRLSSLPGGVGVVEPFRVLVAQ